MMVGFFSRGNDSTDEVGETAVKVVRTATASIDDNTLNDLTERRENEDALHNGKKSLANALHTVTGTLAR
jgi:hypothetical protein